MGHAVKHQRMECVHHRYAAEPIAMPQPPVARVAAARVDADGQVERLGLFVDREEVGVAGALAVLESALEHAARAVLLGPAQVLDRGVDVEQREHRCPPQASVGLRALLGDVLPVAPGQRDIGLGVVGEVAKEDRGEDDVDVHAALVHVPQTSAHVEQLA